MKDVKIKAKNLWFWALVGDAYWHLKTVFSLTGLERVISTFWGISPIWLKFCLVHPWVIANYFGAQVAENFQGFFTVTFLTPELGWGLSSTALEHSKVCTLCDFGHPLFLFLQFSMASVMIEHAGSIPAKRRPKNNRNRNNSKVMVLCGLKVIWFPKPYSQ
jgi:hypothetical protein